MPKEKNNKKIEPGGSPKRKRIRKCSPELPNENNKKEMEPGGSPKRKTIRKWSRDGAEREK